MMKVFEQLKMYDYEQVVYCQDKNSNLKAIIAIHDTTLGPALGGTRMWNYNNEEEALEDVLRLDRCMTYKNAAAGLNLGGGKAVIIGDPRQEKSEALFRAFGRYVNSLNGRYITAEDVGTTEEDMDYIHMETDFVTGTSSGGVGDPSPVTALGIYKGMKAAAKAAFGTDYLENKTVAVQGVGHVAYQLCKYLHEENANLIVTDINQEAVNRAVKEFNATAVEPDAIYGVDCDIYSPCALGGTINDETLKQLDRKSTRLNSSHVANSYAVFCLKKKKKNVHKNKAPNTKAETNAKAVAEERDCGAEPHTSRNGVASEHHSHYETIRHADTEGQRR